MALIINYILEIIPELWMNNGDQWTLLWRSSNNSVNSVKNGEDFELQPEILIDAAVWVYDDDVWVFGGRSDSNICKLFLNIKVLLLYNFSFVNGFVLAELWVFDITWRLFYTSTPLTISGMPLILNKNAYFITL